jgi:hypothetical protein
MSLFQIYWNIQHNNRNFLILVEKELYYYCYEFNGLGFARDMAYKLGLKVLKPNTKGVLSKSNPYMSFFHSSKFQQHLSQLFQHQFNIIILKCNKKYV